VTCALLAGEHQSSRSWKKIRDLLLINEIKINRRIEPSGNLYRHRELHCTNVTSDRQMNYMENCKRLTNVMQLTSCVFAFTYLFCGIFYQRFALQINEILVLFLIMLRGSQVDRRENRVDESDFFL
jgi:hypothetical protein